MSRRFVMIAMSALAVFAASAQSVISEEDRAAQLMKSIALRDSVWPTTRERNTLKLVKGMKLPKFQAKDKDGRDVNNDSILGKTAVINIWYTGCGPCVREMPELSKIKDEFADVDFYSLTYEASDLSYPVIERAGFTWTPLFEDRVLVKYMGSRGYPFNIIVGPNGKVIDVIRGATSEAHEALRNLLRECTPKAD